jgi:hypothetical protein
LPTVPPTADSSFTPPKGGRLGLGLVVWALGLTVGFGVLMGYQTRAGTAAISPPDHWPVTQGLPFDSQRSNLVIFAHPKCPCTRATLDELEVVITQRRSEIKATLCVFDPKGVPADWAQTSLVRTAQGIPGLNVIVDRDGSIAADFGVMTSGQTIMFDRQGRRIFSGGITGMRGQAGENRGRHLVLALARGEVCESTQTPVFGCGLHEETASPEKKP